MSSESSLTHDNGESGGCDKGMEKRNNRETNIAKENGTEKSSSEAETSSGSDLDDRHGDGQPETSASVKTETFNLADPDELMKQLERVDLTEEDTEELLNEAYKVNMKLREILRKQENKRRSRMAGAKSAYSSASVLPPIHRKSSSPDHQKTRQSISHSHTSPKRKGESQIKSRRGSGSKSAKEKPTWDDRFNYT